MRQRDALAVDAMEYRRCGDRRRAAVLEEDRQSRVPSPSTMSTISPVDGANSRGSRRIQCAGPSWPSGSFRRSTSETSPREPNIRWSWRVMAEPLQPEERASRLQVAERLGVIADEPLGHGIDGNVWQTSRQSALKVFVRARHVSRASGIAIAGCFENARRSAWRALKFQSCWTTAIAIGRSK